MVLALLLVSIASIPFASPAQAATISVEDGDVAALIDAINTANTTEGSDTIVLAPGGTYTLTVAVDNGDGFYGPTGLPVVTSTIVIEGQGATITRHPDEANFRILRQQGGDLTLNELTLSNGHAESIPGTYAGWGGCLLVFDGALTMASSTLTGCKNSGAGTDGTALMISSSTVEITGTTIYESAGSGGAVRIANTPSFMMENSTITNNDSAGGIAVSDSIMVLSNVTIAETTQWSVVVYPATTVSVGGSILLPAPVIDGTFIDLDHNILGGSVLLGELQDNGGPTLTRLPLAGRLLRQVSREARDQRRRAG